MKKMTFVLFITAAALLSACTKDPIPGPQGPPGTDGNANVRSQTFVNQSFFFNPAANVYVVFLDWNGLTADVVNKGATQVFIGPANDNGSSWTALPGSFSPTPNSQTPVPFSYQLSEGRVAVFCTVDPGFNADFRVVAIDGN